MKFDILTLFPQMIKDACSHSIIGRCIKNEVINVNALNPRDFSQDKHKKVDDCPYGGGAGMVLTCQPMFDAYNSVQKLPESRTILLTPQGETFNQKMAQDFAQSEQLILICGHYEGFDERIRLGLNPKEVSVGDFVLTGGELAALCIIDSVTRLLNGALGHSDSASFDSFSDGLLEYPQFTKPGEYLGMQVPDVLLSGNHAQIDKYRRKQQLIRTKAKRPDLYEIFKNSNISKSDSELIYELENNNK